MKYSAFCVCLFSAVSAPVFAFDKQQALADPFVAACVDTIQDRLVAPSDRKSVV